jgi:hypothetical protein
MRGTELAQSSMFSYISPVREYLRIIRAAPKELNGDAFMLRPARAGPIAGQSNR